MVSRAQIPKQIEKSPKKWIEGAIKRPGALRRKLIVPPGKTITTAQLNKASQSKNPRTQRQVNLARTLKKMSRKRRS